jgi:hypothetical protein
LPTTNALDLSCAHSWGTSRTIPNTQQLLTQGLIRESPFALLASQITCLFPIPINSDSELFGSGRIGRLFLRPKNDLSRCSASPAGGMQIRIASRFPGWVALFEPDSEEEGEGRINLRRDKKDLNRSVFKDTTPTGSESHNLSFFHAKRGPRLLPIGIESRRKAQVQRIECFSVYYWSILLLGRITDS